MAVFCSMSNPVLVSQSDVSLPLLLPFLMATLSCQWVTPHLWLPDVCFSSLGIIHITQVHWNKIKAQVCVVSEAFYKRWWILHAAFLLLLLLLFCQHVRMKQVNTRSPSWIGSVWWSVFLLSRPAANKQEHGVLWIIPVSLMHYPNGPCIIIR